MGLNKSILNKRKTILSFRTLRKNENKKVKVRPGERLAGLFDGGEYEELFPGITTRDPLAFPGYRDKTDKIIKNIGINETVVAGYGKVSGYDVIALEMEKEFLMGSMGAATGEKITLCIEEAERRNAALVIFALSGGARMQEGMYALMQMAKTAAAVKGFRDRGGLYISVLTNPTTGGVSASFASLGNVIIAEPKALIGFAGPRVIEQTIREKLPEGFQKAEFQKEHGFVDMVTPKEEIRDVIAGILKIHESPNGYRPYGSAPAKRRTDAADECAGEKDSKKNKKKRKKSSGKTELTAYEKVLLSRDAKRPKITDYTDALFDDLIELSGDRTGGEDNAIFGGIGFFEGIPVTVIGHRKGKDLKDNVKCNFGMPGPEGFRKALRLMKEAEVFGRPVITFIDTPGAYPGMDAEEHGISAAIAENLAAMSTLRVPVISVVTGEGSSGGALAIGVADRILMLENAVYSVLSPEGFASILWKDGKKVSEACDVMGMTAEELLSGGIIDGIIAEGEGGIQEHFEEGIGEIRSALRRELADLMDTDADTLLDNRYRKYRNIV